MTFYINYFHFILFLNYLNKFFYFTNSSELNITSFTYIIANAASVVINPAKLKLETSFLCTTSFSTWVTFPVLDLLH